MITKTLRNVSLAFIFIIPFIPLYVANGLFFPFITGKAFAFRIIVEIIFGIWLVLMLYDKKYAPKFSSISLGITVFTIVVLIADLFGMNPLRSIWSNFERMEGWIMIVHLWAYFMAVTSIFSAGDEPMRTWHKFFNTSLFAATIVGLYGMFQLLGWAEIHQGSSRIDASLGNAAYMAVYMLIHTFIAVYMSTKSRWYLVLALLFAFLVYETSTRGTILGLIGGIMLALAVYSFFGRGQTRKSRMISAGAVLAIILVGVLFYFNRDASFIQKNETLRRLSEISLSDTRSQARGYIWPMAIKGTFENPKTALIGLGQENFNYIFNANYDPKMWMHEQWFDRAHSVFIDWLVAGGLVGLIAYVLLFIFAFVSVWRSRNLDFTAKSIFTGLLTAYIVHNIFVFDNLASYLLFFTILGFIHSTRAERPVRWLQIRDNPSENRIVVRDYIYVPVIAILFIAAFYFINIRPIQANTRLITALGSCSGGSTTSASFYAKALELDQSMANQEIREQLLACASRVAGSDFPKQIKDEFYTLSKREISEYIKDSPNDARAYVIGGSYFNNIGDWESGRPLLEKAVELSPNKQSIAFELATNYMNSGREKEASVLLEKTYTDAPENTLSAVAHGITLVLTGQDAKLQQLYKDNPEIAYDPRIIAAHGKLKQYSKVIEGYRALIQKDPGNIQLYGTLVGVYLDMGRRDLALSELEGMLGKFPEAKEMIENAIKQIKAGAR